MKAARWFAAVVVVAMILGIVAAYGSTSGSASAASKQVVSARKSPPGPPRIVRRAVTTAVTTLRQAPRVVEGAPEVRALTELRPCSRSAPAAALAEETLAALLIDPYVAAISEETDNTQPGSVLEAVISQVHVMWDVSSGRALRLEGAAEAALIRYVGSRVLRNLALEANECPALVVDIVDFIIARLQPDKGEIGTPH